MEKEKNNTGIIVLLLIIILGLVGYIVYDKVLSNKEETPVEDKTSTKVNANDESDTNTEVETENKAYKKGEELTLSDGSKWLVIFDSDKNKDYVTVIGRKDFAEYVTNEYDEIDKEIYSTEKYDDNWYKTSKIKAFMDSKINKIPVSLKEVDGYKIRLIKTQEVIDFDDNWSYNNERDDYNYTGSNFNQYFKGVLTMTASKCHDKTSAGKCMPMYNIGSSGNDYFITHWISGVGGLKPVVNIDKAALK